MGKGLEYILSLKDNMTDKVKKIVGEVDKIGTKGKEAMLQLGAGLAGVAGVGASLNAAIAPALEFDRAVGELDKLNVAADAMDQVKNKALQLSSQIGESAMDIAANAYNVKKSLNGIADNDLAEVTNKIHLLGSVTRSNAQTATEYMGQLYNLFGKQAKQMGGANFVDVMAAKTEKATVLFNANLEDIKSGFGALSNAATKYGVAFDEQLAVMGSLRSISDSGSAAAGKYKKIIKGLGKAQETLGLSFRDSRGRMESMPVILDKIKAKFGQKIPMDALVKAFGEDAAGAMVHLLKNSEQVKSSLDEIGKTNNGDYLKEKVVATSDGFQHLTQILTNLKLKIGSEMAEVLYPLVSKLSEWGNALITLITNNKDLATVIAKVTLGFFALTAAVPLLMTFIGIFKLWGAGLTALGLPLQILGLKSPFAKMAADAVNTANATAGVTQKVGLLQRVSMGARKGILSFLSFSPKAFGMRFVNMLSNINLGFKGILVSIKGLLTPSKIFYGIGFGLGKAFLWGLSAIKVGFALIFSPIALVTAAIVGLVALAWKFRTQMMQFINGVISGFTKWGVSFEPIKNALATVWGLFGNLWQRLGDILGLSDAGAESLGNWTGIGELVGEVLGKSLQFIIEVLADLIVGIGNVGEFFGSIIVDIIGLWNDVTTAFQDGGWLDALVVLVSGIFTIFDDILFKVKVLAIKAINWLIEKFNAFTGTSFSPIEIPVKVDMPQIQQPLLSTTIGSGVMNVTQASVNSLPDSVKPSGYTPATGKGLATMANSKTQVINNITVNAKTDAKPQDIARAVQERQQMGR